MRLCFNRLHSYLPHLSYIDDRRSVVERFVEEN